MPYFVSLLRIPPILAAAMLLMAGTVAAQVSSSRADVAEGQRIFLKNCALCHGGDATGGRGPNLARGLFRRATTDARLLEIVQNGIDGTGMPWTGLGDAKASQILSYLRSLRGGDVDLPGDGERGRELFFGAGTCSTCHMVNGEGSRQGPDLSWVGWRRAADYLRQAILEPNAEVEPRWWSAVAVTTAGTQVSGVLVDEDQFAVRLLDGRDVLHSVAKSDLARFERIKTSKMPNFEAALSDEDVDDLVAYLAGLRGGSR